jgi:hypothetical protein
MKTSFQRIKHYVYFSYVIGHNVRDVLCYAVSVLSSYEDGVVILALLQETDF